MINTIMKYLEYPSASKKKYSENKNLHLMQDKVMLPLYKDEVQFYFYNSSTLISCIKDMKQLLSEINISKKNNTFFHFNELKSSLSIEGYDLSINKVSSDIKNKEGIASAAHQAYELGLNDPTISKASLIGTFVTMQKYKEVIETDYRTTDVFITDGIKYDIREKPRNINNRMNELFKFINETDLDPILVSFLTHYVYEDIHPFYDFNGRTGRLLINMIIANKLNNTIPYISSALNTFRNKYYKSFEETSKNNDLTLFILNIVVSLYKYVSAFKKASEKNLSPSLTELLTNIYILNKKSFTIYELRDKVRISGQRASIHEKMKILESKGIVRIKKEHSNKYSLI